MSDEELIEAARKAQKNAYAPYSNFKVGAALLGSDGKIYTGVNVENGSYGLTICAERSAIGKAITEGCLKFEKIAIFSVSTPPVTPCGGCRQVLSEFSQDMQVICVNNRNEIRRFDLGNLLPESFRFNKD